MSSSTGGLIATAENPATADDPGSERQIHRKIWRFATPVILSNVSVPLLGAVDTAVVGRLPGAHYLGAVAVGAFIFGVLYAGMFFLRMGTTGLTAQSFGKRSVVEVRAWLARAVILAAALGGLLVLVQAPIGWAAFALVSPSETVAELAESYYRIRIFGAPFALTNLALLGWFFGVQDTRAALATQIVMNGLNIGLDIAFVQGLGWGVDGVAWATVISEVSAVFLGGFLALRKLSAMTPPDSTRGSASGAGDLWNRAALVRMFAVNRDIFIRSMCLQAAFAAFTAVGARMGDEVLAANAVLRTFQMFMAYALDGFANAAESFVGEAVGAGSRTRLRAVVRASTLWAAILAIVFAVVYALAGPLIIDTLTHVSEVRTMARTYLPWTVLLPILSVWCFQFDGIFVGATMTAAMRNSMIASLAIFAAALGATVPVLGNHGLWASFCLFMVARGLTMARYYPALVRLVAQPQPQPQQQAQ